MNSDKPDPRLHAWRSDLADASLRGRVDATRYVDGEPARVRDGVVNLLRAPQQDAPADSQLVMGEPVVVFEETAEGWAWVQSQVDGYVGWCASEALGEISPEPTHRVSALWIHLYPAPDIKIAPIGFAPMNALLCVADIAAGGDAGRAGGAAANEERFARLANGRFVIARHLKPLGKMESDFVDVARRFLGTPYLWAGRSARGIDCSGLIQIGLAACGIPAPRDSDMQEEELGMPVNESDPEAWQRGDLVFWKGHVGIVSQPGKLLHANAHHMETVEEPLVPAIERIGAAGLDVTSVKRLDQ